jgi:hypothetical protein
VHESFDSIVTLGTANDSGDEPIVCRNGFIDLTGRSVVDHDGSVDLHEGISAAGGRGIDPGRDALNSRTGVNNPESTTHAKRVSRGERPK